MSRTAFERVRWISITHGRWDVSGPDGWDARR